MDEFLYTDANRLTVEAKSDSDPSPYDLMISKLVIEKEPGPVKVSFQESNVIYVIGSVDSLEGFASFFEFGAGSASGEHCHFEYYEGNEWIDKNSEPVVISVM